ncbi:MAG TPA: hypothetical protein VLC95_19870 [Anaerolineae bacterium]|nr:hypothetical protein [Anaerolineae bacterium]
MSFLYLGLPLPFIFDPDASPRDNPWLRGVVSGRRVPLLAVPPTQTCP